MPVHGDLNIMSLPDLLQWIDTSRKTGVLEVERSRVCRRIEFRSGMITACSSDDPPSRLGQFLLSRGRITEDQLRAALARQEISAVNLGWILVESGALTQNELTRQIECKAEETIQGLFDWDSAVFRFQEGATLAPDSMDIRLSVRDVLLRGLQLQDELKRVRRVFSSSGVVLRRTGRIPPNEVTDKEVVRRIFDLVDGNRTLGEILLHAHVSAFLVLKLMYKLHGAELVEIVEERPLATDQPTILDAAPVSKDPNIEGWKDFGSGGWLDGQSIAPDGSTDDEDEEGDESEAKTTHRGRDVSLDEEIEVAIRLIDRREFAAALELLNASYRANPGEGYLRRLIVRAEAAYVDTVGSDALASARIPVPVNSTDSVGMRLGSEESFLMSLIDGRSDIKTLLWLAPLREVDALRILQRMVDRGLIQLRDPEPVAEAAS